MPDIESAIAELAKRQRGYVKRQQLLALGLGPDAIKYRLRTSRLIAVYAGVYAVGHLPTLPSDRAFGALLACGPRAALSHGSAMSLWGVWRDWRIPFEVTARADFRRRGICVHQARNLLRRDVKSHLGLRVTSPARTLLDVAPRLTDRGLERGVNEFLASNRLYIEQLAELLGRANGHPGAGRLRPFVENTTGMTRSELERAFRAFAQRFGLPTPEMNVVVAGYEVDALFREQRVIVELDGYLWHRSRGKFESDRDRDANTLAAGFRTVRVTDLRMKVTPVAEAERLLKILDR